MKSNFTFLLLLFLFQITNSQTFEVDGISYEITNSTNLEAGVAGGCQAIVTIPEQVGFNGETYTVVSVLPDAFKFCSSLTTLSLPNTLVTIALSGFGNCTNLTNFTLPDSVTTIGDYAFSNCQSLTSISLPDGLSIINEGVFFGCNSLTNITIPESVTEIGVKAFRLCDALMNLTLPIGLTTINNEAFWGCENLLNLSFPNTLQTVGDEAFTFCQSFTEANLPNSVTSLGNSVFEACYGITDIVNLPNTLTTLPTRTFSQCIGLTDVVIPSNFTSIGSLAFRTCENLTSITIPTTVTSINERAFEFTYALQTIALPNSLTTIAFDTFRGSGLTEIVIPDSVNTIGIGAFSQCADLTSVTIPSSVNQISDFAFFSPNINAVFVDWTTPLFINSDVFGVLDLSNVTLIVPTGTESTYGASAVWQDFGNITATYNNPISIPDTNFEQALLDLGIDTDGLLNGQIFESDAIGVTDLDVSNESISDLTGLEVFTDLITLYVSDNNISSLDVSNYANLSSLLCQNNQLEILNVKNGNNTNFTEFNALNNPNLECIEVDDADYSDANWNNIDGQTLFSTDCERVFSIPDPNFEQRLVGFGIDSDGTVNGEMLEIDALGVTNLNLGSDNISDLTGIEFFRDIETLYVLNNNLTSINLSQNTQLISATLSLNNLNAVDVSNNVNLQSLEVSLNNITNLDVSQNPNLNILFCNDNLLETLNVKNGNNINFTNFEADDNPNLSCIEVDNVDYSNTIWISSNTSFKFDPGIVFSLDCSAPQTVNVPDSNFEQALIDQNIDSDGVINGQVLESDIINITFLNVNASNISDLTGIEGFQALETLFASGNNLTTIDISANVNLDGLYVGANALQSIDVSNNSNLLALALGENQLTSIDVSNIVLLTQLFLQENQLASINASNLAVLAELNVSGNSLNELDLSQNTALSSLDCSNNDLFNLNVQNGNNSVIIDANFNASINENLSCIQVDDFTYSDTNWNTIDSQTSFSTDCAPGNDDCADAGILDLGTVISGTTFGATSSTTFPSCQEDTIVLLDVWYQFTAPSSGAITAFAASVLNNLDINIAIYDDCNDVEPISCDSGTIAVTDLVPGQTYFIQIWVGGNLTRSAESLADEFTLNVEDTTTLSVSTVNSFEYNVKLVPNPASNIVRITSDNTTIAQVQIFDITGKRVVTINQIDSNTKTIDTSKLSQGIYMLRIATPNTTIVKRLLIK